MISLGCIVLLIIALWTAPELLVIVAKRRREREKSCETSRVSAGETAEALTTIGRGGSHATVMRHLIFLL
jgi:hypothetical protein